ncbi:hypothetical protein ACFE04_000455 [Oxalis oulophora]
MASSQVEIASSSSSTHFGYIRKRRDRSGNVATTRVALPKNLEEFVRGHLSNHKKMNAVDSWVSNEQQQQQQQSGAVPAAASNNRRVIPSLILDRANGSNNQDDQDCESSSLISPRHARILNRWAVARRVPEMLSATSLKEPEIEALTRASRENPQSSAVAQSEPSGNNTTNRGASSLVQIWEARMKRSGSPENVNVNPNSRTSSMSYNGNENENENETIFSFSVDEASRRESEIGEDERCDGSRTSNLEDSLSITDWDSAADISRVISELPSASQGRNLEAAAEREKVHVADIIRRLISENQQRRELSNESSKEQQGRPSSSAASDISENNRVPTKTVVTPKIRGRQAFADLIMRMQGDRQKELDLLAVRQAVTKFSQRGRIQSMLKVRCLERCAAIQDKYRSKSSTQIKQKPHPQGLAVMHLRERFNIGQTDATSLRSPLNVAHADKSSSHSQLPSGSKHPVMSTADLHTPPGECSVVQASGKPKIESLRSTATRPQIRKEFHNEASSSSNSYVRRPPRFKVFKKVASPRSKVTEPQKVEVPEKEVAANSKVESSQTSEKHENEPSSSSNVTQLEVSAETNNHLSQENEVTVALDVTESKNECSCLEQPLPTVSEEREEAAATSTILEEREEPSTSLTILDEKEEPSASLTILEEKEEPSASLTILEEQEEPSASLTILEKNGNFLEENTNEQHQDNGHPNNAQENLELVESYDNWDENEMEEEGQDFDDQHFYLDSGYDWFSEIARPRSYWEDLRKAWYQEVISTRSEDEDIRKLLERRTVSSFLNSDLRDRMDQLMLCRVQQQTFLEECPDEDENEENNSGERIRHLIDYFDQSWGYRESDGADGSDRVVSTSRSHTLPSPSFQECHQFTSSNNQPSMEMELIYNMRGHMEQLQREMSELRKCMMSCMEMQAKMQQTIMQNFHSSQSVAGNSSLNNALPRRNCVICYEMQVDSLLYRCGHMCTCLKCAHELQWSTGKCPICRAPIVDVVRAFIDS